jgi:hypothetical protein
MYMEDQKKRKRNYNHVYFFAQRTLDVKLKTQAGLSPHQHTHITTQPSRKAARDRTTWGDALGLMYWISWASFLS